MNKEKTIKVAMIDDHDLFRKGICNFLVDYSFEILFEAENGKLAMEKIQQTDVVPGVMVVDINTPVMNGFETAKALLEKYPQSAGI